MKCGQPQSRTPCFCVLDHCYTTEINKSTPKAPPSFSSAILHCHQTDPCSTHIRAATISHNTHTRSPSHRTSKTTKSTAHPRQRAEKQRFAETTKYKFGISQAGKARSDTASFAHCLCSSSCRQSSQPPLQPQRNIVIRRTNHYTMILHSHHSCHP
jgi:hypothetical protein